MFSVLSLNLQIPESCLFFKHSLVNALFISISMNHNVLYWHIVIHCEYREVREWKQDNGSAPTQKQWLTLNALEFD